MKYYFAYGSCMSLKDLRRTEPKAKLVGVGRLHGFKLAFTRWAHSRKGGVADVVKATENDFVEGIIFGVPNFKALDRREGAPVCYKRKKVEIYDLSNDEWIDCTTYTVTNKSKIEYQPSYEYVKLMMVGAARLTPEYQAILLTNLDKERCKIAPIIPKKRKLAHPSFVPPPVNHYYRTEWEEYGDIDEREAGVYDNRDLWGVSPTDLFDFDPDKELEKRLKWLDEE